MHIGRMLVDIEVSQQGFKAFTEHSSSPALSCDKEGTWYEKTAIIGQTVLSVAPMYTLTPCLNGSVLDCFRNRRKSRGFFCTINGNITEQ